jgi:predicted nucleic acid-binding protein
MARNKPRPFVDTNVLFSGLYNAGGTPAAILQQHAQGRISMVISRQVLDELIATIRAKKPDLLPALQTFLLNAPPEICADPSLDEVAQARSWINPTDAPILAAALKSGADCLVSGNTRHFTQDVASKAKMQILTPADYLTRLL